MASGHASRINRPNTWLLRLGCDVQKVLANTEPSTHGTKPTLRPQLPHVGFVADAPLPP